MGAENALLDIPWAQIIVEVEPGLADPDDLWMNGQRDQLLWSKRGVILRLVRMRTDRTPNSVIRFGDCTHSVELVEPGADRQHRLDPGRSGARDDRFALLSEFREIQMAMTVYEHRPLPSPIARGALRSNILTCHVKIDLATIAKSESFKLDPIICGVFLPRQLRDCKENA